MVRMVLCVIRGVRREVHENCALLGCYAMSSGNFVPGQPIGPSSPLKMGPIIYRETSVRYDKDVIYRRLFLTFT